MNKIYLPLLLTVATFCFAGAAFAADNEIKDPNTGATFPKTVTFSEGGKDYTLDITGVATRKKFFIKVYSIAHYMQDAKKGNAQQVLQEVFDPNRAKQLTIAWVRPVDTGKIQGAYEDAFRNNLSDTEYSTLKPDIDQFLGFFNSDAKKGDRYILRWTPGGMLTVLINGNNVGQIQNEEFADAVWQIWFGSDDVVKRADLLSDIKG